MFTIIKMSLAFKVTVLIVATATGCVLYRCAQAQAMHADSVECPFEIGPNRACVISFYKLLATPKEYEGQYISIIGYMGISNGRLAVYPTKLSYNLSIEQDSFSIRAPQNRKEALAHKFNLHYVRIVGLFHYKIDASYFRPGAGYITNVSSISLVGRRPDSPADHHLKIWINPTPSSSAENGEDGGAIEKQ